MSRTERLNSAIREVVQNQLRDHNPPETRETLDRLIEEGHSEEHARALIGLVVANEMSDMLRHMRTYSHERYVAALRRLPELPDEETE
jgi:hypothetical protein